MLNLINKIISPTGLMLLNRKFFQAEFTHNSEMHYLRDMPAFIAKSCKNFKVVIDAGANEGQKATEYLQSFPNAQIHSFEPFEQPYKILAGIKNERLTINKLALGGSNYSLKASSDSCTQHSSLKKGVRISSADNDENINVVTLDHYSRKKDLSFIDFFKIDTEGFELEVLKGAKDLLGQNQIRFILVETSFNRESKRYVHLSDILDHMKHYNYDCCGIFDSGYMSGSYSMGWTNVLMINRLYAKRD